MSDEKTRSASVRRVWVLYALLLVLSVPWYFPVGNGEPLVFGFPLWCFVSLCCYVGVALLTIWRLDHLWEDQVERLQNPESGGS
jgi:hypothetical protein